VLFVGSFPCSSRRSQLANALDAGADHCTSSSAAAAAPALRRPLASLLVRCWPIVTWSPGSREEKEQPATNRRAMHAWWRRCYNRARRRRWSRGSEEGAETASLNSFGSFSLTGFFFFFFFTQKNRVGSLIFLGGQGPPGPPIRAAGGCCHGDFDKMVERWRRIWRRTTRGEGPRYCIIFSKDKIALW
jgi:hypothetical protein